LGTLEFRVPDSQTTLADVAAVGAVIQALVVWLSERARAGETLSVAPTWQIEENRWSACRHGVTGWAVGPETGKRQTMRDELADLLTELAPIAERLGSRTALVRAGELAQVNGAIAQREVFRAGGARAVAQDLVARFLEPWAG
jgi:carboxylate-amine ligase